MKSGGFLFALSFLVLGAPAQDRPAPDQPEITSQQAPATFSSRVNLVSVPVVARDNKGHAVGNLRQEDFRLFDQGKQQAIAKFSVQGSAAQVSEASGKRPGVVGPSIAGPGTPSAVEAGAAPKPSLPDHYVAYVFDDIHTNSANLLGARAAAKQHLASLEPSGRAAIATTSGRVFLDFTDDRDKLQDTLLRITPGPSALPPSSVNQESDGKYVCPPDISLYRADRALNWQDSAELAAAEAAAVACYGPDPGPPALGRAAAQQVLSAGVIDTKFNLTSLADHQASVNHARQPQHRTDLFRILRH